MTKHNTGGPAYPSFQEYSEWNEDKAKYVDIVLPADGMTLLDYFAGQALQGLLIRHTVNTISNEDFALDSYNLAQAMIDEKKRREHE